MDKRFDLDVKEEQEEKDGPSESHLLDRREESRSIIFAFTIVFIFFSVVFLLKHFGKLTLDNFIISLVFVFSIGAFWGSHHKKDINEIIEFKEPKI